MTKLLGLLLVFAAMPAYAMGTYDRHASLVAWNAAGTSALVRTSYDYAGGNHLEYVIIDATGPGRSFSLGGDAVDEPGCTHAARELNAELARRHFRNVRVTCHAVKSEMDDPTTVTNGGDKAVTASWITQPAKRAPNAREQLAAKAEQTAGLGGHVTVAIKGKLVLVFGGVERDQVSGKDEPDSGPTDFFAFTTASGELVPIKPAE